MTVAQRTAELQMKVNKAKTQLLCISAGQDEAKAYIDTEQGRIQSSAELKILGFTFGTWPDPGTHVEKMKMKLRSRYWVMWNLKNWSLSESDQLYIDKTTVRPLLNLRSPRSTPSWQDECQRTWRKFSEGSWRRSLGMIDLTEKYWRKKTSNDLAREGKSSAKNLPKKLTKTKNTPTAGSPWEEPVTTICED